MNQKGFAPVIILIGVVVVLLLVILINTLLRIFWFDTKVISIQDGQIRERETHGVPSLTTSSAINWLDFQFSSTSEKAFSEKVYSCIQTFVTKEWKHSSKKTFNTYTESWCKGSNIKDDCSYDTLSSSGQIIGLGTSFDEKKPQVVSGVEMYSDIAPQKNGWGVNFYWRHGEKYLDENGKDALAFRFKYYDFSKNGNDDKLVLDLPPLYLPASENFLSLDNKSPEETIKILVSSAEGLRDFGIRLIDARQMTDENYIRSQKLSGQCVKEGEYQGGGIPPICIEYAKLTEDEKRVEIDKAAQYYDNQKKLLVDNYKEMFNSLMQSFPFQQCFY